MKRNPILFIFVTALFLGSCATEPIVFNESLHEDETVTIHWIGHNIDIIQYNGIDLRWKGRLFGSQIIRIPGGKAEFLLNGDTGSYNIGMVYYRKIPFTFNFENGREYTVAVARVYIYVYNGKSRSGKDLIAVYSMSNGQKEVDINR
jgi:hypothetical protein